MRRQNLDNCNAQEEEVTALQAIYGCECSVDWDNRTVKASAPSHISEVIRLHFRIRRRSLHLCMTVASGTPCRRCDVMLWCTQISVDVGGQVATLCAHLPTAYPSDAVPLVVLEGQGITPAVVEWAVARLEELFVPGEAVLYTWTGGAVER